MGYYKQSRLDKGTPKSKKEPAGGSGFGNQAPIVWVRFSFSPEQKERIKATEFDAERFIDTLTDLVARGHKFTVSPENSNGFVGASLFGHGDECPNKGFGVSGEGGSLIGALKSLHWKLELLQYDLRIPEMDGEDDFR